MRCGEERLDGAQVVIVEALIVFRPRAERVQVLDSLCALFAVIWGRRVSVASRSILSHDHELIKNIIHIAFRH